MRQIVAVLVLLATTAPRAQAQEPLPKLRLEMPASMLVRQQQPVSRALHPAAKGAIIGGAIGAGSFGALGLWYCTIGPNEVGECGVEQWTPGLLVWGAIGAGIGALIGAALR
jgi:hypothetical protein